MNNSLLRFCLPAVGFAVVAGLSMNSPAISGQDHQAKAEADDSRPRMVHESPAAWYMEQVQPTTITNKSGSDVLAAPTKQYSHGEPTDDEQLMLEMINRARANPAAEGVRLVDNNDGGVQFALQFFEISKDLVKSQFNTYPSRPPLAFHAQLMESSERHSFDMVQNDYQGHIGSDNTSPFDRMNDAGYTGWTRAGENVSAYSNSVFHGHAGFNIDWGTQNQIDLGHRTNIMNFENYVYTDIGISIEEDNNPSTQIGPLVVTQNFGFRGSYYVTGVVYNDLNENEFYDPGEGLAGVQVMPDGGDFFAVTSQSGGYAIPVLNASQITSVTASGGDLAAPITRDITLTNNESYKLDFIVGEVSQGLAAPLNLAPADNHSAQTAEIELSWDAVDGAENYEIEIRENDAVSGTLVFSENALTETSVRFPIPQLDVRYFWHVRAMGGGMISSWSATHSFELTLAPPMPPELVGPASGAEFGAENIVFSWKPSESAEQYRFIIADNEMFNEPYVRTQNVTEQVVNIKGDGTWEYTFNPTGLLTKGNEYWWAVHAVNAAGEGDRSEIRAFGFDRNVATSATLSAAVSSSLVLSPNPVKDVLTLNLDLPAAASVNLALYDARGSLVGPQIRGRRLGDGPQVLRLETAGLTSGVYTYRLEVDERVGFGTFVIVR